MKPQNDYNKILLALKPRKKGATVADVCAATALPLRTVRELLPKAADEYSGHLKVTESGEILYYFPDGFTSRYRGFSPNLKKAGRALAIFLKAASVFLFKIWIMVMLFGYFALFLLLALASVLVIAFASKGSSNKRSSSSGFGLFNLLWRIWFVKEITRPRNDYGYDYDEPKKSSEPKRPLFKSIFSFVFGEEDPNKNWQDKESKAVIAYIQANRGVISMPEYMAFSGQNSLEAESSLLAFCSRYGGSPEATEDGTVVYRFDELLLRADNRKFFELSPPIKTLKTFSVNTTKMNTWFIIINTVNLLFGSYFLYHSVNIGLLAAAEQIEITSYFYFFTYILTDIFFNNPILTMGIALGIIPVLFSIFFWVIPAARKLMELKENENIKLENFKRMSFGKIWSSPNNIDLQNLHSKIEECSPKNIANARDRVIKDLGAISSPDIKQTEAGKFIYNFDDLQREKTALENYRSKAEGERRGLGETVFNTGE